MPVYSASKSEVHAFLIATRLAGLEFLVQHLIYSILKK